MLIGLVVLENHGNSNYGTAAVGTYNSGTGQQGFGTPVVFNSGTTEYTATTFDSAIKWLYRLEMIRLQVTERQS